MPAFPRSCQTFPRTLSLAKHTRRLGSVRQALSHPAVVVLKTRFHCEHISALLNLGSCLLIQRVGLSKCVCVRACALMCVCIINYTDQRPTRVIPACIICVYLTKLMLWFTGTFVDIIPLHVPPLLCSVSAHLCLLCASHREGKILLLSFERNIYELEPNVLDNLAACFPSFFKWASWWLHVEAGNKVEQIISKATNQTPP